MPCSRRPTENKVYSLFAGFFSYNVVSEKFLFLKFYLTFSVLFLLSFYPVCPLYIDYDFQVQCFYGIPEHTKKVCLWFLCLLLGPRSHVYFVLF